MKNIRIYTPNKYNNSNYEKVEENIYKTQSTLEGALKSFNNKEIIEKINSLNNWKLGFDPKYPNMDAVEYDSKMYYKYSNQPMLGNLIFTAPEPIEIYVTSLVFVQEPEFGENEPNSKMISQYPLEDILEKFGCYCTDFFEKENEEDKENSYQEFASKDIEDIRNLLSIIGKHVYNKKTNDGKIVLVIE